MSAPSLTQSIRGGWYVCKHANTIRLICLWQYGGPGGIAVRKHPKFPNNPWVAAKGIGAGVGVVLVIAVRPTDAKVYYVQEHIPEEGGSTPFKYDLIVLDSFNWTLDEPWRQRGAIELLRYISFLVHLPALAEYTAEFQKLRGRAEYVGNDIEKRSHHFPSGRVMNLRDQSAICRSTARSQ